jgi:peptidyl-prolyl cis-trans isomerase SurA
MRRLTPFLGLIPVLLMPARASAQDPQVKVDTLISIIAIVGDSIITNVEVQQALDLYQNQTGQPLPQPGPDLDKVIQQMLEQRINMLLVVQAATRDTTISVSDEEVRLAVDRQVEQVIQQTGSRAAFERALQSSNLTVEAYREILSSQVKEERLRTSYFQKVTAKRKPPPVSEQEIRDYWKEQVSSGSPPQLPPSIAFHQIVIPVTASDSALAVAKAKADSIYNLIVVDKEDFAQLARRFGEDGTRDLGGDLGYFRPGQMVAEFERAAYALAKPGEVSHPVRTQYGYHIIKLERIRGPERQARHILIRPTITDADKDRARAFADTLLQRVRDGASMDSLQRQYGDKEEPATVPLTSREGMPAAYQQAVGTAGVGDLVGPFELADAPPNPAKFVILRIERIQDAREATVDDYRAQIQQVLARQKLTDEILGELRRSTYVEIRAPGLATQK